MNKFQIFKGLIYHARTIEQLEHVKRVIEMETEWERKKLFSILSDRHDEIIAEERNWAAYGGKTV